MITIHWITMLCAAILVFLFGALACNYSILYVALCTKKDVNRYKEQTNNIIENDHKVIEKLLVQLKDKNKDNK